MHCMFGSDLIFSASGSIIKAKNSGDRGQLCLIPLMIWNVLENIPIVNTYAEGEEYNANIAFCIGSDSPNFSTTLLRYPQCTLSKVLSASNVIS